jgi:hypothetical protein
MKTYIVTVIYYNAQPIVFELEAFNRKHAVDLTWEKYDAVIDHIQRLSVVLKWNT